MKSIGRKSDENEIAYELAKKFSKQNLEGGYLIFLVQIGLFPPLSLPVAQTL